MIKVKKLVLVGEYYEEVEIDLENFEELDKLIEEERMIPILLDGCEIRINGGYIMSYGPAPSSKVDQAKVTPMPLRPVK